MVLKVGVPVCLVKYQNLLYLHFAGGGGGVIQFLSLLTPSPKINLAAQGKVRFFINHGEEHLLVNIFKCVESVL